VTTVSEGRSVTSRGARSRQAAATPPESMSSAVGQKQHSRARAVPDGPSIASRRSRRLAGGQSEFGMLRERRGAMPVGELVPQPSRASQRNRQGPVGSSKMLGIGRAIPPKTGRKKLVRK
jgi:hypothetical protein